MSTAPPAKRQASPANPAARLQVSNYERVASMLIALLVLVGLSVLVLFLIWLTMQIFAEPTAADIALAEIGEGGDPGGERNELNSDVEAEFDTIEPSVDEQITAIDGIAAAVATMDSPSFGQPGGSGKGGPGGFGGTGGGKPGQDRGWRLVFPEGNTLKTYAKQLDHFGIQVGAFIADPAGGAIAESASDLSSPRPTVERRPASEEERYYFTWEEENTLAQDRRLSELDKQLLQKAGIPSRGKILHVLKFIPPDLEKQMMQMERQWALNAGKDPANVRATVFEIRQTRDGYTLAVKDQKYTLRF